MHADRAVGMRSPRQFIRAHEPRHYQLIVNQWISRAKARIKSSAQCRRGPLKVAQRSQISSFL
jgi:hypothetical protein